MNTFLRKHSGSGMVDVTVILGAGALAVPSSADTGSMDMVYILPLVGAMFLAMFWLSTCLRLLGNLFLIGRERNLVSARQRFLVDATRTATLHTVLMFLLITGYLFFGVPSMLVSLITAIVVGVIRLCWVTYVSTLPLSV